MVRKNEKKTNYWHSLATFTSVRGIDSVRTQPGGGGQAIVTNFITVRGKGSKGHKPAWLPSQCLSPVGFDVKIFNGLFYRLIYYRENSSVMFA